MSKRKRMGPKAQEKFDIIAKMASEVIRIRTVESLKDRVVVATGGSEDDVDKLERVANAAMSVDLPDYIEDGVRVITRKIIPEA